MGRLLLATGDVTAALIDSEEKKIVDWFVEPEPEVTYFKLIHAGAWSPDGERIAIGLSKEVSIRNPENLHEEERRVSGHKNTVQNVAWSPKGDALATSSTYGPKREKNLKIWDTRDWKLLKELEVSERKLFYPPSLSWSPRGERLAVGIEGEPTLIVNADTWEVEERLEVKEEHQGDSLTEVAWNPKGSTIAVTRYKWVWFWGKDGHLLKRIELPPMSPSEYPLSIYSLSWGSSGRFLAGGCKEEGIIIIDTETWEFLKKKEEDTYAVAWSPNGDFLASSRFNLYLWDTETWEREVISECFKREGLRHSEILKELGYSDTLCLSDTRSLSWEPA